VKVYKYGTVASSSFSNKKNVLMILNFFTVLLEKNIHISEVTSITQVLVMQPARQNWFYGIQLNLSKFGYLPSTT
jgi:hypothetical protein